MTKHWPYDPAWVDLHGEMVEFSPWTLLEGMRKVIPFWMDPALEQQALVWIDQLELDWIYEGSTATADYAEEAGRLADAALYAVLGIYGPDARQFCIDTLNDLVP